MAKLYKSVKLLTLLLHPEWPKRYSVLAILSAIGLNKLLDSNKGTKVSSYSSIFSLIPLVNQVYVHIFNNVKIKLSLWYAIYLTIFICVLNILSIQYHLVLKLTTTWLGLCSNVCTWVLSSPPITSSFSPCSWRKCRSQIHSWCTVYFLLIVNPTALRNCIQFGPFWV